MNWELQKSHLTPVKQRKTKLFWHNSFVLKQPLYLCTARSQLVPIVFSVFVTDNGQEGLQYVWVRSLAVTRSIVSRSHRGATMTVTVLWVKHVVIAYILHGPYAHKAAGLRTATTAQRPFWIHELFCCLWYNREIGSDFLQGGGGEGRGGGGSANFPFFLFVKKWEHRKKKRRELSSFSEGEREG